MTIFAVAAVATACVSRRVCALHVPTTAEGGVVERDFSRVASFKGTETAVIALPKVDATNVDFNSSGCRKATETGSSWLQEVSNAFRVPLGPMLEYRAPWVYPRSGFPVGLLHLHQGPFIRAHGVFEHVAPAEAEQRVRGCVTTAAIVIMVAAMVLIVGVHVRDLFERGDKHVNGGVVEEVVGGRNSNSKHVDEDKESVCGGSEEADSKSKQSSCVSLQKAAAWPCGCDGAPPPRQAAPPPLWPGDLPKGRPLAGTPRHFSTRANARGVSPVVERGVGRTPQRQSEAARYGAVNASAVLPQWTPRDAPAPAVPATMSRSCSVDERMANTDDRGGDADSTVAVAVRSWKGGFRCEGGIFGGGATSVATSPRAAPFETPRFASEQSNTPYSVGATGNAVRSASAHYVRKLRTTINADDTLRRHGRQSKSSGPSRGRRVQTSR
eukprot:TRINITY_DN73573_c0_g1_i1.p1 TRINITY_DN73573_c0_g1~~TRINITY_DN73573_c0_g1_i1.p1  ORF type:complete len:440 (-),score=57.51 TRINITY_DN73573_c0_g1_i1:173-1492(-)